MRVGKAPPNDLIYLVMRLYWPKTEPPSILPPGSVNRNIFCIIGVIVVIVIVLKLLHVF